MFPLCDLVFLTLPPNALKERIICWSNCSNPSLILLADYEEYINKFRAQGNVEFTVIYMGGNNKMKQKNLMGKSPLWVLNIGFLSHVYWKKNVTNIIGWNVTAGFAGSL